MQLVTQVWLALHVAPVGQSLDARHATHAFVEASHTGVGAEQSALVAQYPQRPGIGAPPHASGYFPLGSALAVASQSYQPWPAFHPQTSCFDAQSTLETLPFAKK